MRVDSIRLDLPWPPSALRPNAASPGAWRRKQTAAKAYRADCAILCRASWAWHWDAGNCEGAHVTLRFCPPDRRRRDLDNLLASFKQGIDAISEAIGVDDSKFSYTLSRGEPVKGGVVQVTISEAA